MAEKRLIEDYIRYRDHIKAEYISYFDLWYVNFPHVHKSPVIVLIDENNIPSGYSHSSKIIILSQGQANIDDINLGAHRDVQINDWSSWKRELIHEMIHEYQFKINPPPSLEGTRLYNEFQQSPTLSRMTANGNGFDGSGHDEIFYTALCIIAQNMEINPVQLKRLL